MSDKIFSFEGAVPQLAADVFVAEGARVIGQVQIGAQSSVWYNAVLRADSYGIQIGTCVNIQDNCVLHSGSEAGEDGTIVIGDRTTVGHGAIVHACRIEEDCLIGMNAVVLDGAVIKKGSIVGTGAVVTKGTVVPENSLVLGIPARVVKTLGEENLEQRRQEAEYYHQLGKKHQQALK